MASLKQGESGVPVSTLCRENCMSSASYYKWRTKFGGLWTESLISRLKERENARLKRIYTDALPDADILKEVIAKNASAICPQTDGAKRSDDVAKDKDGNIVVVESLIALSLRSRARGFGLMFLRLCNVQVKRWNHKHVYRVYCELKLNLRIKPHQ